jgi:MOSC domain-containing protein YiiM
VINPASPLSRLFDAPMRPGRLLWIGIRPARRAPMQPLDRGLLSPEAGLEGDRYAGRSRTRQVTLIAAEHLAAIGAYLGRAPLDPALLRRNLVVQGVNLLALKGARLRIGGALLRITGECHPCSRMEEVLGPGGYNAVRGHGGLTAEVLEAGALQPGDAVTRCPPES